MTVQTDSFIRRAANAVDALRASMGGQVLTDTEAGYDSARQLWNGAVDRRPMLIARCVDQLDVQLAVRAADDYGLSLSVRGGSHDWAGRALTDRGLVIDLSEMRAVAIGEDASSARAEGGASAGDVVSAARPHGRAPVTGTIRAVGIAGLTLAGGYGPLCGRYGLALDNLLAAELVLADGRVVVASERQEADLYWGLRGGGGTLGVVTAARYRLHPIESVLSGLLMFPLDDAAAVLRGYTQLLVSAPDELTVATGFLTGPGGEAVLFLFPTWCGEEQQGQALIDQLRRLGDPVMAQVGRVAYEDALGMFDAHVVNGHHYEMRTRSLAALDSRAAEILIEAARQFTSPLSAIALHHFHGAASRVPTTATAFGLRQDHWMVEILAGWEPTAEDPRNHRRWAKALSDELAAVAVPGGYPNLLGPEESDRAALAYGPNADRLSELRRRYDPDGVFSAAVGSFGVQTGVRGHRANPRPTNTN